MSTANTLLSTAAGLWGQIVRHRFVLATADGSLEPAVFDRWLIQDHWFVLGFRRFLAGLVTIAPDERAREVLTSAFVPLNAELVLFREEAARRGLSLDADPGPTTLGYTSFVLASLQDGYDVALTVLYGAEKAYFDAWRAVRERTDDASPYRPFIENWSSDAFGEWTDDVASLLDETAPSGPTDGMRVAFDRVVRFEIRFWDAVASGEDW